MSRRLLQVGCRLKVRHPQECDGRSGQHQHLCPLAHQTASTGQRVQRTCSIVTENKNMPRDFKQEEMDEAFLSGPPASHHFPGHAEMTGDYSTPSEP